MGPDVVVLFEPVIDHGLGLSGFCEPFGASEPSPIPLVGTIIMVNFKGG
jgi:hypothetical protein